MFGWRVKTIVGKEGGVKIFIKHNQIHQPRNTFDNDIYLLIRKLPADHWKIFEGKNDFMSMFGKRERIERRHFLLIIIILGHKPNMKKKALVELVKMQEGDN